MPDPLYRMVAMFAELEGSDLLYDRGLGYRFNLLSRVLVQISMFVSLYSNDRILIGCYAGMMFFCSGVVLLCCSAALLAYCSHVLLF